jgi:mannosyltransferase OCH1-like enzyme
MNVVQKVYGEEGIFNKLKTIKYTHFEIKDSYQPVVPLNLYLTWSIKQLPPKMQENVDRMRKVNPEFNIQIFDCDERRQFIKNNFPEDILTAYDTLKPGAYKADLWRLCVLYINGGIYVDIKFNCINNFKFIALTEREHLLLDRPGHWKEGEIGLANGIIVAKPKNNLLLRCINKISENVKDKNYDFSTLYPTGPGLLGEQYIKMLRENESTMEAELDKLDLCMENEFNVWKIIFNNVVILEHYKEYRAEQKLFAKTLTYDELYLLKQIYNEVVEAVEPFNNNIDENTSVFNRDNLILFCAIIIVFLLFFK